MEPFNPSYSLTSFQPMDAPSSQEPVSVYTPYETLPCYPPGTDLNCIAEAIKSRFEDKSNWKGHFDAIDNIRVINKYYPDQVNNIFVAFGAYILEHLENQKRTNVFRNCLFLMKEIFRNCKQHRLADEIIQKIVPALLTKINSEKQLIKEEIKAILEEVTQNCLYESTFTVICQLSFEKNPNVAEAAIKTLARMLSNMGQNLMNLPSNSFQVLFKTLATLLDERKVNLKNANLKTWTLQICNYIYRMVGMENFVNFLHTMLNQEEATIVKQAMEKPLVKKESKKSRVSLGDYLKFKRENNLVGQAMGLGNTGMNQMGGFQ